jgi:hypothetical protein
MSLKPFREISAVASLVICAALAGCASGPDLRANADPGADFTAMRTFGFMQELGTDGPGGRTMLSARLSAATTRELTARGLQFLSSNPDVLVNFFANVQSGTQTSDSAVFLMPVVNYGAWPSYRSAVTPGERINEGTLGVHIVDRQSNRLVWEGIASERVTEAMLDNPDETINRLVEQLFKQFPR